MTPMTIPDAAIKAAVEVYEKECDRYDLHAFVSALTAALPFLQGVKVRPMETAPNGEGAEEPSAIEVHEGAWAVVKGTNGKNAGWIDTHDLFAHQFYRHHTLSGSAPVSEDLTK